MAVTGKAENLVKGPLSGDVSVPTPFQQNLDAERLLVLPVAAELAEVSAVR